jgi:beta-lactamase superfamily II metal-dependent hydrolase
MAKNKYRYKDQFFINDLKVQVYVIGYGCYGESTVLLIMNGDDVYYSIVIDSYHYQQYKGSPLINKAVDILNHNHVEHLDVLCWTHPHDDHSRGITTILKKFCDEDTTVLYPLYVEDNTADIVKLKQVSKNTVDKILEINRSGLVRACPIGVIEEKYNNVDEFEIINTFDDEDVRKVRIDVITPISHMLTTYVNDKKCDDPNELSITLILDIDDYGFYFGGDTTNDHIDASNQRMMRKCRFIKIPHHASNTANHLPNFLQKENVDAICTSVFEWGRSHNPNPKVIKEYQTFFKDIYTTNKSLTKEKHGIIMYEYDFSTGYPSCDIHTEGNVGKLDIVQ